MRIILLGTPGSGKGAQATRLTDHYRIPRISTGVLLFQAVLEETVSGRQAKAFFDLGQHVPDEVVSAALKERLRLPDVKQGFLLAGFPRTAAQAAGLDAILEELDLPIDLVLLLAGDPDQFMERLEGRRVCSSCGAMYNLFSSPSRVEGVCDQCGGQVRRRADDNEETISSRMRIFEHQSPALIEYYRLHGKLRQVQADGDLEQVFQILCNIIDEHPPTMIETEPVAESPVPLLVEQQHAVDRTPEESAAAEKVAAGNKTPVKKRGTTRKKTAARKKAPAVEKAPVVRKATAKKKVARKKVTARKKASAVKKAPVVRKATAKKKAAGKKVTARKKAVARKKAPAVKKAPVVRKVATRKKVAGKKVTARKKAAARKKAPAVKKAPVVRKAATRKKVARKKVARKKVTARKKRP